GHPRDGGEEALADLERHVDTAGVAPLGHDVAVAEDQAVRPAAFPDRADDVGVGPTGQGLFDGLAELDRDGRFVLPGPFDGLGEQGRVHADLVWRADFPVVTGRWEVRRG